MKIGVILCLVAGPLVVRAQQQPRGATFGVQPGNLFGWKPLAPRPPGALPWPMTVPQRDSVRILVPDRMHCLVAMGADPMPIDRRRSMDRMPNGVKQVRVGDTVR